MSIILADPVDVIRYILEQGIVEANIEDATAIIKRKDDLPVIGHHVDNQVFIRPYGIVDTEEQADLFYNYLNRVYSLAIDIEALNQPLLTAVFEEVRRVLLDVRKIVDFDDSGVNDAGIKNLYDLIFLKGEINLTEEGDGIFRVIQHLELQKRFSEVVAS